MVDRERRAWTLARGPVALPWEKRRGVADSRVRRPQHRESVTKPETHVTETLRRADRTIAISIGALYRAFADRRQLPDQDARPRMKSYWTEGMDTVAELLANEGR